MDLDSALNELGMLSIVTESRKDYIKERASQRQGVNEVASASSSFHIVKMNTQFVTCVGSVPSTLNSSLCKVSASPKNGIIEEAEKSASAARPYPAFLVNEHRVVRTHRTTRRHQKAPYTVPHSHRSKAPRLRKSKRYFSTSLEDDVFLDDVGTDCNGNGRKYRSPSTEPPEKALPTSPPILLHRSKSLDDLHLERLRIDDGLSRHRSDVELASKLISNLQVS